MWASNTMLTIESFPAVSYPFTSLFGISHGHAVSLTLNKFLKYIKKSLEDSLKRLETDYVDIFQLHAISMPSLLFVN